MISKFKKIHKLKSIKRFILFGCACFFLMTLSCSLMRKSLPPNKPDVLETEDQGDDLLKAINCNERIKLIKDWTWDVSKSGQGSDTYANLPNSLDKEYKYAKCVFIGYLKSNSQKMYANVFLEITEYDIVANALLDPALVNVIDFTGQPLEMNILEVGDVRYYQCLHSESLVRCLIASQYTRRQLFLSVFIDEKVSLIASERLINSILTQMDQVMKDMPK